MHTSEAVASEHARWNAFVASSSVRSFLQTWEWGQVQQTFGVRYWRVVIENGTKILAVALVIERRLQLGYSWLYIPRGPIFLETISDTEKTHAWDALEEKLKNLAEECGAFFVRIDPALSAEAPPAGGAKAGLAPFPHGWRKSSREVQPRNSLLLDLTLSQDELFSRLHPKTRYNIRTAQRKNVQVRFSRNPEDVDKFYHASKSVTRRTGFAYHPDAYYHAIMEVLGKAGMAELAIAQVDEQGVAAHLMIYADGIATYSHGASMYEQRAYMAPALLYWETILRAKEKHMQQYDFFGVAPEDADDQHPWAGVTRIKMGFGGSRISYCGAYDFVLNEGLYTGFMMMRGVARTIRSTIRGL